jgi:enhancing lycopene biosynthesis protein 2
VYEIGAHEMTCPSKKNMIDLEQKLLETSKVLAEEISQVS